MKQVEEDLEVLENSKTLDVKDKILDQTDLYEILPFGKTKIQKLIKTKGFPVMKIGKDYITTFSLIEEWIKKHIGEEIYIG